MKKIALIGAGRIAHEVVALLTEKDRQEWEIGIALARRSGERSGFLFPVTDSIDRLLDQKPDLVIETAGPDALKQYGEAALAVADVWSVSAAALSDEPFYKRLEHTGRRSGHHLRLVSGAIGGLDALAAMAVNPGSRFHFIAGTAGKDTPSEWPFSGTIRQATQQFHGINVLAAAALAAKGFDEVTVDHEQLAQDAARHFELLANGPLGHFRIIVEPASEPARGTRLVAASIVAALRQETAIIQTI